MSRKQMSRPSEKRTEKAWVAENLNAVKRVKLTKDLKLSGEQVKCSRCGKPVSNIVFTINGSLCVRAYVECPECVEKYGNRQIVKKDGKDV